MSNESKHTPGPWTIRKSVIGTVVGPEKWKTGAVALGSSPNPADLALVAAAPDLLDALKWVLPEQSDCERCKRSGTCVGHAAIARAEGRR